MARTFRQIPRIQGVDKNLVKILEPMRDAIEQLTVGAGRALRVPDVGNGLAFTKNKLIATTAAAIVGGGVTQEALDELNAQFDALVDSTQQFRSFVELQLANIAAIATDSNTLDLDTNGYVVGVIGNDVPGDDVEEVPFVVQTDRFGITRPAAEFELDTAYSLGDYIIPSESADVSTGLIYEVTIAGTTDDTDEPDWTTADDPSETVTSGTVTFTARTPDLVNPFGVGDVAGVDTVGIEGSYIIDRSIRDLSLSLNVALLDRDEQVWTGDNRYTAGTSDQLTVGNIGTDGYIALSRGTGGTAPGYARFYNAAGTSLGYVGFHDSSSRITLTSENAFGIRIDSVTDIQIDAVTVNRLIAPTLQIAQVNTLPSLAMNGATPMLSAGGSAAGDAFWMLQRYNAATGGPDIGMYHSRGASVGTHTILAQNDEIGSLSFYASDGTSTPVKVARIIGFINDAVGGATDLGTRISIFTTPDGSVTPQVTAFFSPAEIEFNATTFDMNGSIDLDSTSGAIALDVGAGYVNVTGSSSSGTIAVLAQNALPRFAMLETDASAENQLWYVYANAERFNISAVSDDRLTNTVALFIDRTGTTIDLVRIDGTEFEVNATTIDFNGTMDVSLVLTVQGATGLGTVGIASGGDITVSKASASVYLVDAAAASNEDVWRIANITGDFFIQTRTDANAAGVTAFTMTRTGTAVDLIQFNGTELEFNGTTVDINATIDVTGSGHSIAGTLTLVSAVTFSTSFDINAANSFFFMTETGVTAENGTWLFQANGEALSLQLSNDAKNSFATWLRVERTANTVDSLALTGVTTSIAASTEFEVNTTLMDLNGNLDVSGTGLFGGTVTATNLLVSNTSPTLVWVETDAAANNQRWDISVLTETFNMRTVNDAANSSVNFMVVNRTLNVVDSIQLIATTFDFDGNIDFDGTTFDIDAATSLTLHGGSVDVVLSGTLLSVTASSVTLPALVGIGEAAGRTLSLRGTDAFIRFTETTTPPTDEGVWLMGADSSGAFHMYTRTDADGTGETILNIGRTGVVVDLIQWNGVEFEFNGTTLDINATGTDISGALTVNSTMTVAATVFTVNATGPQIRWNQTNGAVDNKHWIALVGSEQWVLRVYADNLTTNSTAISIDRTGTTIDEIELNATTLDFNGTADFSGSVGVGIVPARALHVSSTAAWLRLDESDAGTNEKVWLVGQSGGASAGFQILSRTDADGAGAQALQILRTGTVIDEIQLDATLLDFNGNLNLSGAAVLSGVVTPTALAAGDNDNVDLGVGSVIRARIAGNAATSNLTGVTNIGDGKLLILTNISANTIMIINEDLGSTAANRFAINGDMVLPANCSAIFIYDDQIDRWTRLN